MIGAIVALFAAALLSSVVSPYKVLLSWDTFWIFTVVLFAREIWRAFMALRDLAARYVLGTQGGVRLDRRRDHRRRLLHRVMMTSRLNSEYAGNYSGFLQLGKHVRRANRRCSPGATM